MNCELASKLMHEYFDGDLARDRSAGLKAHLLACPSCRASFDAYERTEAYVHAKLSQDTAGGAGGYDAAALTARIMQGLPGQAKRRSWTRWFRNHPAVTAAAVFAVVMLASVLTAWEQDEELIVKGSDLAEVVIDTDGETVIVPEGVRVDGDLTVENGKTIVSGEIAGNLTVIDGTVNMASTAKVLGNSREINQALDWIWYKVTSTVGELAS